MAMRPEACAAAGEALPVETTAPTPDATIREGEMEGALHAVGELGYRAASVRAVLEYSGAHRKQFYEHFDSLEDCFAQAYSAWIDQLGATVLATAVAADGWRESLQAGLVALFRFVAQRPEISRALFVEVQVAGGEALAKHDEAIERLAGLLDTVRAELAADDQPPDSAGVFVVAGVEACVCDALAAGEADRIWDALPELMHLAVGTYLGKEAADEALAEARALLEGRRASLEGVTR